MVTKRFLSISTVALWAALSATPALAGGGSKADYQACLAKAASAPNERQVNRARSECMWRHFDYMASYGP